MLNNNTGTIYIFQETRTGTLFFKTTDIRELLKAVPSQIIAMGESFLFKNIEYEVDGFEIEISSVSPRLNTPHSMQIGENNPYAIQAIIYATKK